MLDDDDPVLYMDGYHDGLFQNQLMLLFGVIFSFFSGLIIGVVLI